MLLCLFFTLLIELLFAFILKLRNKRDYLNIILVNIITNPILVISTYIIGVLYGNSIKDSTTYILEILVVIVEGFIYKKFLDYKKIDGYFLSFILNACSYLIGLVISSIIYQ